MIKDRNELAAYMSAEEELYRGIGYKGRLQSFLTQGEAGKIRQYVRYLRYDEFYSNQPRTPFNLLLNLYYRRKHNRLGWQLGISIPVNTFEKGLLIFHSQGIIVHKNARIGEYCRLHGNVCIGNDGTEQGDAKAPVIGSFADIGVGAEIIGDICLADHVRVAAGAVVVRSCPEDGAVLIGVPAVIKRLDSEA